MHVHEKGVAIIKNGGSFKCKGNGVLNPPAMDCDRKKSHFGEGGWWWRRLRVEEGYLNLSIYHTSK